MKTITNIPHEDWQRLERLSRCCSFFQTAECYAFLQGLECVEAFAFGVEEKGSLKGVIAGYVTREGGALRQFFSRRAIINGGPMLAEDISEEALCLLLTTAIKALRKKAIYIEIRNFFDYSKYRSAFEKAGFTYAQHLNFHVDTSSAEVISKNVSRSVKRYVGTSLRSGASVITKPDKAQILEFYGLLHELYRTKVRTPLFPPEFFTRLAAQESARLFLVQYKGRIVGGTLCVIGGARMYEWYVCGQSLKEEHVYPALLATWSAMSYCAENGIAVFDMMGAGKPSQAYGVRDFKSRFGGTLVQHGRFTHVCSQWLYGVGVAAVWLMKKGLGARG